jgi:hypothetical protein
MVRAATAFVVAMALVVAPAATAKFRMQLMVSPAQPRAHALVRVEIRADEPLGRDAVMKLGAVAPGAAFMDVVAQVAGQGAFANRPLVLKDSFAVRLRRVSASTWRGTLRFPRAGAWRLVVPNWGAPGYANPVPIVRAVRVR